MPCFDPRKGYASRIVNPSGKRSTVFNVKLGLYDMPRVMPCGQCLGCRLERSREWAIRCMHEASLHEYNTFITLTYDQVTIPPGGTLLKKDYQDFMKRLRWHAFSKRGQKTEIHKNLLIDGKIRFYQCGEYGKLMGRPHYHACIFGLDFKDKKEHRVGKYGDQIWRSQTLEDLWPLGFSEIGTVTFKSAAYVARYIMKKVNNKETKMDRKGRIWVSKEEHYKGKLEEYTTMSRKPGVAYGWYEQHKKDVYPRDEIIVNEKQMRPPSYYDRLYEKETAKTVTDMMDREILYSEDYERIKRKRKREGIRLTEKEDYKRLDTKQEVLERKMKNANRNYEQGKEDAC